LTEAVGGYLPDDVRALYEDHNGSKERLQLGDARLPVRLMPVEETLKTAAILRQLDFGSPPGQILWLCSDDNSNYAGFYFDGPLRGFVVVLDHEETDLSPRFRSVSSFISHMLDSVTARDSSVCDAGSIPAELPTVQDNPEQLQQDRALANHFLGQLSASSDEQDRQCAAYVALRLLPMVDMERVTDLLHDEDMWISERAVKLVAHRRWEPGVSHLGNVIETGGHNARMAACWALLRWQGSELVRQEIQRLHAMLEGKPREAWEQACYLVKTNRR
jgi:hypothetical protein